MDGELTGGFAGAEGAVVLGEVERRVLGAVAAHPILLPALLVPLVGSWEETVVVLRRLLDAGLVAELRLLPSRWGFLRIMPSGLGAIGREHVPAAWDLARFRHDLLVGQVWQATAQGRLTPMWQAIGKDRARSARRFWTGHELAGRAHDGAGGGSDGPAGFGVRVAGEVARALHYPDLVAQTEPGLVAMYVVTGPPEVGRLRARLTAYGLDPRWEVVLFLVAERAVGEPIMALAEELGLSDLCRCQLYTT